jgi:Ulp1 family protease
VKHAARDEDTLTRLQQYASRGRQHIVLVFHCDREKVNDGQYWNDNLIDLWIRWTTWKESTSQSAAHFFSTHFYTTLLNEGVEGVSKWTMNKGIDVFSKKILIIPVNLDNHWSLIAVFSPLMVSVMFDIHEEDPDEMEWPALIFLDPLRMHDETVIAK